MGVVQQAASRGAKSLLPRPAIALTTAFISHLAPRSPGSILCPSGTLPPAFLAPSAASVLGPALGIPLGRLRRRGGAAGLGGVGRLRAAQNEADVETARTAIDRSNSLLRSKLSSINLETEWLPSTPDVDPLFVAITKQMQRQGLLPENESLEIQSLGVCRDVQAHLHEHAKHFERDSPLDTRMAAAAHRYGVSITHIRADEDGVTETTEHPEGESSCTIHVASLGPLLWSTTPLPETGLSAQVQAAVVDEVKERFVRAGSVTSAVQWMSSASAALNSQQRRSDNSPTEQHELLSDTDLPDEELFEEMMERSVAEGEAPAESWGDSELRKGESSVQALMDDIKASTAQRGELDAEAQGKLIDQMGGSLADEVVHTLPQQTVQSSAEASGSKGEDARERGGGGGAADDLSRRMEEVALHDGMGEVSGDSGGGVVEEAEAAQAGGRGESAAGGSVGSAGGMAAGGGGQEDGGGGDVGGGAGGAARLEREASVEGNEEEGGEVSVDAGLEGLAREALSSSPRPETTPPPAAKAPPAAGGGGSGAKVGGHYLLVDISGYIFRAYHVNPLRHRSDNVPTHAVFGFCRMLIKLMRENPTARIVACFDHKDPSIRKQVFSDYKATRPPCPEDLKPQFEIVREAAEAFGLPCADASGYEADDIIATYCAQATAEGAPVTVVSSDKDLLQLVSDSVTSFEPMKSKRLGPVEVEAKMGVPPERVVDLLALVGDVSDNVPGIRGIGNKWAAQFINEFGTLDNLLDNAEQVKQKGKRESILAGKEQARLSRDLVRLKADAPVTPLSELRFGERNASVLQEFLDRNEFTPNIKVPKGFDTVGSAGKKEREGAGVAEARPRVDGERRYELVTTPEALAGWLDNATSDGMLGIDVLGTSEDAHSAGIVGLSLALRSGDACYIPLAHERLKPKLTQAEEKRKKKEEEAGMVEEEEEEWPSWQGGEGVAFEMLRVVLEDPSVLKVGHNVKYIWSSLRWHMAKEGLEIESFDDVMLLNYIQHAGKGASPHELDGMVKEHFGEEVATLRELPSTKKGKAALEHVSPRNALGYGAQKAAYAVRLHQKLKPELTRSKLQTPYETMERPLVKVLASMEANGILVDQPALEAMSAELATQIEALESKVFAIAGRNFSIASPKQLGEVLFEEMEIPGGKRGKSGTWTTDSETLGEMAEAGFEIATHINEWRQQSKLKSAFTDSLQKRINPRTGRIHTKFAMAATATGRLSSLDPNLQNIPAVGAGKKVRETFVAKEGHLLMAADYSQIELRLLASLANIDALQKAFMEGTDVHALTASQVFNISIDDMTPAIRRNAKAINFGIIYGQTSFGLAKGLGVTNQEAQSYIDSYFKQYPGICKYMQHAKDTARRNGYVQTLFGRRCHLANINGQPAQRSYAERQAINAPIQGLSADIIKRAMVRMPKALEKAGLGAKMLLQVHDELVFEVPEEEMEETKGIVRSVMEGAAEPAVKLAVPLVVDVGVGTNWGDAH